MDFTKKYTSKRGDLVIGRVLGRQGDYYQVDIGDRFIALLQYYDFEGASKRNRPHLDTGSLLYARVKKSSKHMNPVLSCSSHANKKTWSSGEAEFMEIRSGYLQECSIGLVQFLLGEEGQALLQRIGKKHKFSATIGHNGRLWIDSGSPRNTILIVNTLLAFEASTAEQREALVQRVSQELRRN